MCCSFVNDTPVLIFVCAVLLAPRVLGHRYSAIGAWHDVAVEVRSTLDSAVQELKTKLAVRSLKADERSARAALSKVTDQLSQRDPAWWKQALSEHSSACEDLLSELSDRYSGVEAWVPIEQNIRLELEAATTKLRTKLSARDLDDDTRTIKATLASVATQLKQADPAWWKEGLKQAQVCRDQIAELSEKHENSEAWQSVAANVRASLNVAQARLQTNLLKREQQDDERSAKAIVAEVCSASSWCLGLHHVCVSHSSFLRTRMVFSAAYSCYVRSRINFRKRIQLSGEVRLRPRRATSLTD